MSELKDLCLQCDTRQQVNRHNLKEAYFKQIGIRTLRSKLPFGDYSILGKGNLVVDTKKDFMELAGNLTKDHIRFRNEIVNANSYGIGLVILIEEDYFYANLDVFEKWYQIPRFKNNSFKTIGGKKVLAHRKGEPMASFNVSTLVKVMKTMQEKYAVLFRFTTKEKCGEEIIKILHYKADVYNDYFNKKLKKEVINND